MNMLKIQIKEKEDKIMRIFANFIIDKFLEKRNRLGLKPVIKADNMEKTNNKN
jgi:hypothetical protein